MLPDTRAPIARARPIAIATILLAAALLFGVQPMVAKAVAPRFGGSAGIWTVCLAFFQTALFSGYLYAHLSHGRQFVAESRRGEPLAYYTRTSGIGRVFAALDSTRPRHVGVVGLGVGTLDADRRRVGAARRRRAASRASRRISSTCARRCEARKKSFSRRGCEERGG